MQPNWEGRDGAQQLLSKLYHYFSWGPNFPCCLRFALPLHILLSCASFSFFSSSSSSLSVLSQHPGLAWKKSLHINKLPAVPQVKQDSTFLHPTQLLHGQQGMAQGRVRWDISREFLPGKPCTGCPEQISGIGWALGFLPTQTTPGFHAHQDQRPCFYQSLQKVFTAKVMEAL